MVRVLNVETTVSTAFPPPGVASGSADPSFPGEFAAALADHLTAVLRGALQRGQPAEALSSLFEVEVPALQDALAALDLPLAATKRWRRGPVLTRWDLGQTRRMILWWLGGVRVSVIAEDQGRKTASIYAKARQLGLPKRDRRTLTDTRPPDAVVEAPAPEIPAEPDQDLSEILGSPEFIGAPGISERNVDAAGAAVPSAPKRKKRQAVPEACRGFEAPKTRREFDLWLSRMYPNLLTAVRVRLAKSGLLQNTGGAKAVFEDAVSEIHLALIEWFYSGYEQTPDVPRWTQYDPSRGIEFFQFITAQIPFKIGDYFKRHNKRRKKDANIDTFEFASDFDAVVHEDAQATQAMSRQSREMSAEMACDMRDFQALVHKISSHHAESATGRSDMVALSAILDGWTAGRNHEEIHADLEQRVFGTKLSNYCVKQWRDKLIGAASMYREMGARDTLRQFGVHA